MRTSRTYLAVCLLLASCAHVHPVIQESSEVSSAETPAFESDGEGAALQASIVPSAYTGSSLAERALPTGFLEVGDRDAPHTMLLITNHQCGYCADFSVEHIPVLVERYIRPGILRLSVAILPLKKYPGSAEGVVGLLCAAAQGKGWPMHTLLSEGTRIDRELLLKRARTLQIDETAFATCLEDEASHGMLQSQHAWIRSLGVEEVPTYFIDGVRYTGLPYAADLEAQLSEILQK